MAKKYFNILIAIILSTSSMGQEKAIVYGFPGQGSDRRIFDSIMIDTALFDLKIIEYNTPDKSLTLKEFAFNLSQHIDTTVKFNLIGVSLGGMICVELSEILNPQYTIIISSAKNRNELPFRYRFQKIIPLYKIFPGSILLAGAKILQPIVEPDVKNSRQTFKSMLGDKDPKYMKRTIKMIITWKRKSNTGEVIHIHGNKDRTLPIRKINNPTHIVENGSHVMALTRAGEINKLLSSILKGCPDCK